MVQKPEFVALRQVQLQYTDSRRAYEKATTAAEKTKLIPALRSALTAYSDVSLRPHFIDFARSSLGNKFTEAVEQKRQQLESERRDQRVIPFGTLEDKTSDNVAERGLQIAVEEIHKVHISLLARIAQNPNDIDYKTVVEELTKSDPIFERDFSEKYHEDVEFAGSDVGKEGILGKACKTIENHIINNLLTQEERDFLAVLTLDSNPQTQLEELQKFSGDNGPLAAWTLRELVKAETAMNRPEETVDSKVSSVPATQLNTPNSNAPEDYDDASSEAYPYTPDVDSSDLERRYISSAVTRIIEAVKNSGLISQERITTDQVYQSFGHWVDYRKIKEYKKKNEFDEPGHVFTFALRDVLHMILGHKDFPKYKGRIKYLCREKVALLREEAVRIAGHNGHRKHAQA